MTDAPTALNLPIADPLPEETQKYFDICRDKLGMVPNVLQAYAFDVEKLNAFTAMYNDLMLGDSALTKLEREMIAVVVSAQNHCFYCGQADRCQRHGRRRGPPSPARSRVLGPRYLGAAHGVAAGTARRDPVSTDLPLARTA